MSVDTKKELKGMKKEVLNDEGRNWKFSRDEESKQKEKLEDKECRQTD